MLGERLDALLVVVFTSCSVLHSGSLEAGVSPPWRRTCTGRQVRVVAAFIPSPSPSLLQTEQSMKARARELAVCVPYVKPSVDSHARSDLCLSPPILSPQSSYQPPQPDAAIRLGPKFQVSTVPAYQGPSCTDACERGDQLLSLAEVELALARTTACRITAAAFHEPGVRLDLVKGEWLAAPRRRRQQPRCSTFGCSLPDLHAGLHQVARATLAPPVTKRPHRPHAPRRWPARSASGGWAPDAGRTRCVRGAGR